MNIFVAKLNFRTTDERLLECFQGFGEVSSAKVIFDKQTGRSKGFGFVEMSNDAEAENAINSLNETEFDGSQIVVKKAIDKEPGSRSGGGDRSFQKRRFSSNSGGGRFDNQRSGGNSGGGYKPRYGRED